MAVGVVSVPVADQDRSLAFYRDALGLVVAEDQPMGPAMRWLQLRAVDGGATVALVTWFEAMRPGGLQGLSFHVPDIEAAQARIVAAGIACAPIADEPWGRYTTLKDPDGNGLIVAQPTRDR